MPKVLIVAGEPSGDLHAAHIFQHIKEQRPDIDLYSAAGTRTARYSAQIYDLVRIAAMGLIEIIRYLPAYFQASGIIESFIRKENPALVILVDFPDFNLRLAQRIKRFSPGTKIIYYISPQVWAWRKSRIKIIQRYVDAMLVIFKFEEDFYRSHGVTVFFVGHPLLETVRTTRKADALRAEFAQRTPITLMPGSRFKVVQKHLPLFLDCARRIARRVPQAHFFIIKPAHLETAVYEPYLKGFSAPYTIVSENPYDHIAASSFALVSSGTATIEVGIVGTPFVILYCMNPVSFRILRTLVRTPYIGMINIIFQKKIVAEFIQQQNNPQAIADFCVQELNDPAALAAFRDTLRQTRTLLGEKEYSSSAAAKKILSFLT